MGSIYEGSYITLTATASEGGTGGLFVEHDTQAFDISLSKLTVSTYGWRDGFVEAVIIKVRRMLYITNLSAMALPLTILQCMLGPTKNVSYQPASFIMTRKNSYGNASPCRSLNVAVGGSTLDPLNLNTRDMYRSYSLDCREISNWHTLISAYTTLSLTCGKNRLLAFSDIAKQLVSNPNYLASLRRKSLILDLSWRTIRAYVDA